MEERLCYSPLTAPLGERQQSPPLIEIATYGSLPTLTYMYTVCLISHENGIEAAQIT